MSGYVPPPKNFRYEEAQPVDIHAKRWAEYEKHGKAPAAAKEKVRVALRIGVFFDGTRNNASNSASGLLCGAHHPIRGANFALSTVIPAHTEIPVPGVHSDIGGGYREEVEECVLISPMQALTVQQGTDIRTTSIYRDAQQQKASWVANGWPETMLEIVTPKPSPLSNEAQTVGFKQVRAYAGLQLKRWVSGKLSVVYLHLMHKLAKEKGVQFDVIDESDPAYSVPSELQPFCNRVFAGNYEPTAEEEKLLKLKYIHMSANWSNPVGASRERGVNIRYTNAPTESGVRARHPHLPDSNWRVF
ncbi:hypothetical protein ACYZT9_11275 [Pseudomonas sp. ZT5P21]